MIRDEEKNLSVIIRDIVALLSQIKSGDFKRQLDNAENAGILRPVVEELNTLVQHLRDQAQTEKFFTLSQDLLCIGGPDATFQQVNPSFKRVLGYSESELLEQSFLNLIHPEDVQKTLEEVEKHRDGKVSGFFENRLRAKDGSYRTLAWTSSLDSETGCVFGIAKDITEQKQAEIELKTLSDRLQAAELISKLGFWELDLETFQGKWSNGHFALLGLVPVTNAPTFEKFIELVHPEDRLKVQTELARILAEKVRTFEIDFRILADNGKSVRWFKEHGTLDLSVEGKPLRLSGSIQDVTKAKLAEIELRAALDNLNTTSQILERTGQMAKVGGWELDLSTGRVNMSKETQRIHEIDENYVPPLYSTGSEWYPPESWPIVQAALQTAIELGKPYDLESKFITANGRTIWVRVQGFPIVVAGKVTHLQGTFQDITDRKEKELESKFIGDAIGFGIWKFDPLSNTLEWDDGMYKLYGVEPKDFSGAYSAWQNALSPKAREDAVNDIELALRGEKEFNTEFEITLPNGDLRYIAARGIVRRNDKGEPLKMYGLNWDVSSRVRGEIAVKTASIQLIRTSKLVSLGEMAAGVAHEINNPLAIISGAIHALPKFVDDPPKLSKRIETIQGATERIAKIVRALKKYSRTEDKPEYRLSSLQSIVREALVLTSAKAQQNETSVEARFTSEGFTLCDEIEIEQVMINLINNGIDAANGYPEKWVRVEVCEDGTSVIIRVRDSGQGISDKVREKLFQPFFTTKPIGQGTGLGLSIVKGILDEHQASIDLVADSPNTCFELRFKKAQTEVAALVDLKKV